MSQFIQPLEPSELASRFSNEDSLEGVPTGLDEEWKQAHLKEVKAVLDRLPEDEADILEQYFFRGKKQTNIAEIFNKTQAAVSYNIKRALQRVRFLVNMPDADKHDVYDDLKEWRVLTDELDAQIFAEMYETSCQSEVADRLDLTQGRVRHRFLSNLSNMGSILLERLENWVSHNIDDTFREEMYADQIDDIRKSFSCDEMEDDEYENEIREVFYRIREVHEYDLGDLGKLFEYYRTFVKIRHSYNILRKIDLPRWQDSSEE